MSNRCSECLEAWIGLYEDEKKRRIQAEEELARSRNENARIIRQYENRIRMLSKANMNKRMVIRVTEM